MGVTFNTINYYIKLTANLNSIVDYNNNNWGLFSTSMSSTDISNVEYYLPSGSISMKMGQINFVPSGDSTDIKGSYDVILHLDASSNGTMSSIVTLSGDDTTITIDEDTTLKQQLYWSYNDVPEGDQDILSITSNKVLTSTFHATYLNNLANEFTGFLVDSWNSTINQVITSNNNIIVDIANHNDVDDSNVFKNGDTVYSSEPSNYELYVTDYNGVNQEIIPPTNIYFAITHDDNGMSLN